MAITASTTSNNRIVRCDTGKTLFDEGKNVVSSAVSWKQGDLIAFDATAHLLKLVAATSDAATIVGIADSVVVAGVLAGPYDGLTAVNAAQVSPGFIGPKYGVVASMKLHTGDAFHPGDKIYLSNGDDSQTVSSTDPGDGNNIGIYVGALISSAAAGQQGLCKIGSRYGQAGLVI